MSTIAQYDNENHAPYVTRWSLVARAQVTDPAVRMEAMEGLCHTYLPVLRWYLIRHTGLTSHEGEDIIQGFIASNPYFSPTGMTKPWS